MRRTLPFLLAIVLSLAVCAPAQADLLRDLLEDYVAEGDGRLDACRYTQAELKKIKDAVPVDQNAYSADFVAALDDAIALRAEGGCNKNKKLPPAAQAQPPPPPAGSGALVPAPPPPSGGSGPTGSAPVAAAPPAEAPPEPGPQPQAAPEVAATDSIAIAARATDPASDAPFPVFALAVLAALAALGAVAVALVRWMAWEPSWAHTMRHAAGEAGWRASSTWAEFTDFVRFGR